MDSFLILSDTLRAKESMDQTAAFPVRLFQIPQLLFSLLMLMIYFLVTVYFRSDFQFGKDLGNKTNKG